VSAWITADCNLKVLCRSEVHTRCLWFYCSTHDPGPQHTLLTWLDLRQCWRPNCSVAICARHLCKKKTDPKVSLYGLCCW
jgi:hypothetical protein